MTRRPTDTPVRLTGVGGLTLAHTVSGPEDGRLIILAHGGGQTRHAWRKSIDTLSRAGFRVVAYDHRGHGDSDRATDGDYRFVRFGEDMACVLKTLAAKSGQPPIVVGASLGGLSALIAGRDNPGLLGTIILVDVVPQMDPSGVERIQFFMRGDLDRGFSSLEEAAERVAAYLPNRKRPPGIEGLRKNLRQRDDGRWVWHWDPAFVDGALNINAGAHEMMTALDSHAPLYDCPIRLIRGGASDLIDLDRARSFIDRCRDGRLVEVERAGHMVAGDRNDAFDRAVLELVLERMSAD